jgi:hypothetical protein
MHTDLDSLPWSTSMEQGSGEFLLASGGGRFLLNRLSRLDRTERT